MKTFGSLPYVLGLMFVSLALPARAQVCTGNVTLETQAQVNAFACTEVTGILTIGPLTSTSQEITDLTPLSGLAAVRDLWIWGNAALASLAGLEDLDSVGGLTIYNNDALTSLAGLEGLTSVGGDLEIWFNDALVSLAGLENITSVGNGLYVISHARLASLAGLESLTSVGGSLTILSSDALTSLEGLEGLASVDYLSIRNNDALASLAGLENITSVGRDLWIWNNDALTSLAGLEGLTSVGGDLEIWFNDALVSLAGLEGLANIGGLSIRLNDALVSLEGLESLTAVHNLTISGNDVLTSLAGLEGLTSVGGDLSIDRNAALAQCSCGLSGLISGTPPAFSGVGDTIAIFKNAPGGTCTSPDAVLADPCTTTASEPPPGTPTAFALTAPRPNPFTGTAALSFALPEPVEVRLSVYDLLGREVAVLAEGERPAGWHVAQLDGRDLAAGVYAVRLTAGAFVQTHRVTLAR